MRQEETWKSINDMDILKHVQNQSYFDEVSKISYDSSTCKAHNDSQKFENVFGIV